MGEYVKEGGRRREEVGDGGVLVEDLPEEAAVVVRESENRPDEARRVLVFGRRGRGDPASGRTSP